MIPIREPEFIKEKREIQAQIYEEIKNMTTEEMLAYYRKGAEDSPLWQWLTKTKTNKER